MSYTYLLEQGEESLAESFSDIPQSVLSRLSLTAVPSCCNDSGMESYPDSRSGIMSSHLTASRGADLSMSSVEDSPVKTSAFPILEQSDFAESEADCGEKCGESFAKFDRDSYSWKTRQLYLFEELERSLETWPRWGTMRDGECWAESTQAPTIVGREFGFWPTPVKMDAIKACGISPVAYAKRKARGGCSILREWLMLQITPDGWGPGLTGRPNADWVEWLMMWPSKWTGLRPLATAKFRQWLHSHGESSANFVYPTQPSGKIVSQKPSKP